MRSFIFLVAVAIGAAADSLSSSQGETSECPPESTTIYTYTDVTTRFTVTSTFATCDLSSSGPASYQTSTSCVESTTEPSTFSTQAMATATVYDNKNDKRDLATTATDSPPSSSCPAQTTITSTMTDTFYEQPDATIYTTLSTPESCSPTQTCAPGPTAPVCRPTPDCHNPYDFRNTSASNDISASYCGTNPGGSDPYSENCLCYGDIDGNGYCLRESGCPANSYSAPQCTSSDECGRGEVCLLVVCSAPLTATHSLSPGYICFPASVDPQTGLSVTCPVLNSPARMFRRLQGVATA